MNPGICIRLDELTIRYQTLVCKHARRQTQQRQGPFTMRCRRARIRACEHPLSSGVGGEIRKDATTRRRLPMTHARRVRTLPVFCTYASGFKCPIAVSTTATVHVTHDRAAGLRMTLVDVHRRRTHWLIQEYYLGKGA